MCMKIQFVYMKIKFSFQRREILLFLATNMAAVRHVQTSNCSIAVLVAIAFVVAETPFYRSTAAYKDKDFPRITPFLCFKLHTCCP